MAEFRSVRSLKVGVAISAFFMAITLTMVIGYTDRAISAERVEVGQKVYYAFMNAQFDNAPSVAYKSIALLKNLSATLLLWLTSKLHWSVEATVNMTAWLFWLIIATAIFIPTCVRLRRATKKDDHEKIVVDIVKELNPKAQLEDENQPVNPKEREMIKRREEHDRIVAAAEKKNDEARHAELVKLLNEQRPNK